MVYRRKFRSQTSDNMDKWKAEVGKVREEKRRRKKISKKRKSQKKEDPGARKGRKVARHCVFPMVWGSGGSKSRLAKAAGAEPAGQIRDEKLCAVVARSAFASQNVQNTWVSEHVWKLRCRKSARRCSAKHISKSKCRKHTSSGPLLEVEMSKKCTSLWRKAHFEVKNAKNWGIRITFGSWDVEKVHAVVARSTCRSQNVQSTPGSDHFWKLRCRKRARRCGAKHISKSKVQKTEEFGALLDVQMSFRVAGASCQKRGVLSTQHLDYTTLQLHLDYIPLRLHYTNTTLHYTALHWMTLHYAYNYNCNYTTLHL